MPDINDAFFRYKDGFLTIKISDRDRLTFDTFFGMYTKKKIFVRVGNYKKPRTCGPKSQNSHAWGHCTQIARELAVEVYEVEYIAKVRAIKRGYPVSTKLGFPIPKSQADISTEECAYLIEEYHMIAAENGITLIESEPEILAKPEGFYRDAPKPKSWHEMTRAEQAEADPERFDREMQLDIF